MEIEILAAARPEDFLELYPKSLKRSVREVIVKHAHDAISSALLGNSVIFIAKRGGETVGMVELIGKGRDVRFASGGEHGCVFNLYVREDSRGQGIGSLLMMALIREAGMREMKILSLAVEQSNGKAIPFYHRLGFSVVKTSIADGIPVLLMQKSLEQLTST